MAAIPVTILTGFLGSGKTTVLNRLLRQPGLGGTVAIINEFGEIGLDHLLIETSEEQFALLDNGCICCTVRGDLVATLAGLEARHAERGWPAIRRVVIETTGLADPAPILHTLMVEPAIAARFRIDGVVATVDAVNGAATLDAHPEALKQVAVADRLIVTKTDLADEAAVARLEARLAAVNPAAGRIVARDGHVAAADILDLDLFDPARKSEEVVAWFRAAAEAAEHHHHDHACGAGCHHPEHAHSHRDGRIRSHGFVIDAPVSWAAFAQWLDYVAALKGEDLLRFKGLVHVAEHPDEPLVVHGVQHVIHPPRKLEAWPSDDRQTRLVFIVRDIPRPVIERTLAKFAAIDAERIRRPAA